MIVPASDTSSWHPEVRAAHAATNVRMRQAMRRHDELFELVNAWRKEQPVRWHHEIDVDRQGWALIGNSTSAPPLEEAAILFDEIIHHLRTALNISLQEVARRAAYDVRFDLLQYPISLSAKEFRNQRNRLQGLPAFLRRAIEYRQPFVLRPNDPRSHPLSVLAELNNDSKHRTNLQGKLGVESFETTLVPVLESGELQEGERRLNVDLSFQDRWEIIREDTSPFRVVDLEGALDLVVDVAFEDRRGQMLTATLFTQEAFKEVSDSIGFLFAPWNDRLTDPESIFRPQPGASFMKPRE